MGFTAGDTLELLRACEPRACELLPLLRRCSGVARGRSCRSRCRLKTEEGPRVAERKKENTQPKGGMGGRHAATTQGF